MGTQRKRVELVKGLSDYYRVDCDACFAFLVVRSHLTNLPLLRRPPA
jgi:hypothetical protein